MHSFLKAIGFSQYNTKKLSDQLVKDCVAKPTEEYKIPTKEGFLVQINREYCKGVGITVIGEIDQFGFLNVEYSFPYVKAGSLSHFDQILFQKKADTTSFSGVCDDISFGVSIIFYLQNISDYVSYLQTSQSFIPNHISLAGLSTEGMIILGIEKNDQQLIREIKCRETRKNLLEAAKKGDARAIEHLTLSDIDEYTLAKRRALKEDIFSFVETYFMPWGTESDQYHVMGIILGYREQMNSSSNELIYVLDILTNDITVTVCINKDDLYGEPEVGRRFKGVVWLQGNVTF